MGTKTIEKLEELVSEYIGRDCEITETIITNLTAPGENYGSQIYKIDIKLKKSNGDLENLNVVAKQIPESEFFQEIFNVQITFDIEQEFYKTIVPLLRKFQETNGLEIADVFPRFFGARRNLNGIDKTVDKDAVIILENLKVQGYKNLNRYIGFDLPTTILTLRSLAEFHAVALALKLKEPKTFEEKIKSYCTAFLKLPPKVPLDKETNQLINIFEELKIGPTMIERFKKSMTYMGDVSTTFREPFATLVHRDFWVNNIMIYLEEGASKTVKFVDFQMYSYDSPATDVLFFLFTSVQTEILKQHLDDLLQAYHKIFIQILSDCRCDTDPFSYDNFLEEIKACMKTELGKMVFMFTYIVRGPQGGCLGENGPNAIPNFTANHLTREDKDRLYWLLEEFNKRGWLHF